jgi:hypothetical protein
MAEESLVWGGTTLGDATLAVYDADEHGDMLRDLFMHDRTDSGVLHSELTGYDGELEVTNPAGATIRVATGIVMVDGTVYYNSANVDNASGSAPGQFERAVLRKHWANQTVRVVILGPGGVQPALTQNDGVQWEIPLATIENVGGVLTITDERLFLPQIAEENLEDGAVTQAKIVDEAVTLAKFAPGAMGLQSIESTVLGAPAASITFSSISALYSHLEVLLFARGAAAGINTFILQFNGVSSASYNYSYWTINQAGTVAAGISTDQTSILVASMADGNSPANVYTPVKIIISAYSEPGLESGRYGGRNRSISATSMYYAAASALHRRVAGYLSTSSPVSQITLTASGGGNFATGTEAYLYGMA